MWAWLKDQVAVECLPVLAEVVEVPKRRVGAKER